MERYHNIVHTFSREIPSGIVAILSPLTVKEMLVYLVNKSELIFSLPVACGFVNERDAFLDVK